MQACKKVHLASGVIDDVHCRKNIANLKAHLETKDELILSLQVIQTFSPLSCCLLKIPRLTFVAQELLGT